MLLLLFGKAPLINGFDTEHFCLLVLCQLIGRAMADKIQSELCGDGRGWSREARQEMSISPAVDFHVHANSGSSRFATFFCVAGSRRSPVRGLSRPMRGAHVLALPCTKSSPANRRRLKRAIFPICHLLRTPDAEARLGAMSSTTFNTSVPPPRRAARSHSSACT